MSINTNHSKISLADLDKLRTAPELDEKQAINLLNELNLASRQAEWFTIGIMAPSTVKAIQALNSIQNYFKWSKMEIIQKPNIDGPVFLKANQKSNHVYIRIEHGLGEGILLTGQHSQENEPIGTWGPFPIDFFAK